MAANLGEKNNENTQRDIPFAEPNAAPNTIAFYRARPKLINKFGNRVDIIT